MSSPQIDPVVEVIKQMIVLLVDEPDEISVEVHYLKSQNIIEVMGGAETGKILGRGGRLADAIRVILQAIAKKSGERYEFEVCKNKEERVKDESKG